jgi:septal ring-binding cell division protein DamX
MTISKKMTIISVSVATLILIVGIAAFIWLRMMEIPSELNIAAKQDKQSVGMTKSPVSQTPVTRKTMPPAPPIIMETVSQAPGMKPTVTEPQTEVVKQDASNEVAPTTEKLVKAEPPSPAPKTEPKPVKSPEPTLAPAPAPAPSPKEPKKVEIPEPQKAFAFTMQVGAFLVKKNADERIRILEQMGQKPYAFDSTDKKGTQWHTVRIGHYETIAEARKDLENFKNTSPFDVVVIYKGSLSPLKKNQQTGAPPADRIKS